MTGLPGRIEFQAALNRMVATAFAREQTFTLLLLNPDDFFVLNERFGHEAGDAVIREIVGRLRAALRRTDLVYRYGGEEFVILAPETGARPALHVAERVRRAFELRSAGATAAGAQTLSIGVNATDLVEGPMECEDLLRGADTALYRAKNGGRNRVCCYDPIEDTQEL